MMRMRSGVVLGALLLVIAACGDESGEGLGATTSSAVELTATSTSTPTSTSTTSTTELRTTSEPAAGFEVLEDIQYHGPDDRFRDGSGVVDIYRPDSVEGPWPVVVVFHGDPSFVDKMWTRPMAEELASRGYLVITPTWGRTSAQFRIDASVGVQFAALTQELRCALRVAFDLAATRGGDADRLTVVGYSAGGNAALMAVLSDAEPLAACEASGPAPDPAALVAIEADVLLGAAGWDGVLADDPEAFYSMTPWRALSAEDDFPIHIVAVEIASGRYNRSVGSDPHESFLADRHIDIDVVAELEAMGLIDDGDLDMVDAQAWAVRAFEQAGYDVSWVLLEDTRHAEPGDPQWGMSDEAWEIAVETILTATGSG